MSNLPQTLLSLQLACIKLLSGCWVSLFPLIHNKLGNTQIQLQGCLYKADYKWRLETDHHTGCGGDCFLGKVHDWLMRISHVNPFACKAGMRRETGDQCMHYEKMEEESD